MPRSAGEGSIPSRRNPPRRVSRCGVIVSARGRVGLLLPNLEGIDTVAEQVGIARQKAGLRPDEPVQLARFEVNRYE